MFRVIVVNPKPGTRNPVPPSFSGLRFQLFPGVHVVAVHQGGCQCEDDDQDPGEQDDRLQDEVLGQQLLDSDPSAQDDSVVE